MYTCDSCGKTFYTGEPVKRNGETLCHYCIDGEPQKIRVKKDVIEINANASHVGNILKKTAIIIWVAGSICVLLYLLFSVSLIDTNDLDNSKQTASYELEIILNSITYCFEVFIGGMVLYGFGEIVTLLTQIRDRIYKSDF